MTSNANNKVLAELKENPLILSPMGNLTVNLSGASLSSLSTPSYTMTARRLSLSNLTPGTPADNSNLLDNSDNKYGTPKISKNILRSSSGRATSFRRMNSAPVTLLSDNVDSGQEGNRKKLMRDVMASSPMFPLSPYLQNGRSLEMQDSNSRDSGFSAEDLPFRFPQPVGIPIKKTVFESPKTSGNENLSKSPSLKKTDAKFSALSFTSPNSEDGFLELGDFERSFTNENEEVLAGFGNLLKGPLLENKSSNNEEEKSNLNRPPLRRFNSLMDNYTSPASSRARIGLFRDEIFSPEESPCDKLSFKRPREIENNSSKRRKSNSLQTITERAVKEASNSRYKLQRSISETAASSLAVMLHKSDLIADFTRAYALPIVSGRHEDLKSITADTLAELLNGEYSKEVDSFKIIDCRYPYEYEGGHIKGSINLYTKEQVEQELLSSRGLNDCESPSGKTCEERHILIFHCEFSVERGPALYRYLRRCDRNLSSYPSLHYPEVYLLHGGYESFFSTHKSLCEPCSYQPMVDPKHENDLRRFRIKSNSWSGDSKKQSSRSGLKRLGLF